VSAQHYVDDLVFIENISLLKEAPSRLSSFSDVYKAEIHDTARGKVVALKKPRIFSPAEREELHTVSFPSERCCQLLIPDLPLRK
jgi:hypothetical protein